MEEIKLQVYMCGGGTILNSTAQQKIHLKEDDKNEEAFHLSV